MNEYQDQAMWFELWGYDGVQWEFIADFDTREAAHLYDDDPRTVCGSYEQTRIKRVYGLPA